MIAPWNRKELTVTLSVERRRTLARAGIDYTLRTKSLVPTGRTGRMGAGPAAEYRFYVRRKDWERARELL